MKKFLIFLLVHFALVCPLIAQQSLLLVANGKSVYTIQAPADATEVESQAALELAKYIQQVSGCKIPVLYGYPSPSQPVIFIGRSAEVSIGDTAGLGGDGIILKSVGKNLVISGGNRKGVLYAVYTLLEDYFGFQRFTADDLMVPRVGDVHVPAPLYHKYTPSFPNRMTFFPDTYNYEYTGWRKLNMFLENWGLWVHSFDKLLPPDQYFKQHPEYFALVDGKRNPAQIDLTNRTVLKIVVENLAKMIADNPGALYWSVSQNDNPYYCDCNHCSKLNEAQGSPQGSLLAFVNAVARNFPNKVITTLAYSYSEVPPLTLKPEKNVMVMLATGNIVDRSTPINYDPSIPFNDHFSKWSEICPKLFVWDYIAQYDHIWLPFPNIKALQPNIRYFASKEVFYLFEQGIAHMPGALSELKCYLVSKLMWDKDANVDSLTNVFVKHYYGKEGANAILKYLDLLQKNAAKSRVPVSHFGKLDAQLNTYLSKANIGAYRKIFEKALRRVDPRGTMGKRLMKEYLSVVYAELENYKQGSATGQKKNFLGLLDFWKTKMEELGYKYVSLPGLTVTDYYLSSKSLVN